ncbi:radical SAM/CxCxxxxC motif protein YfkAB [Exiguobacterium sp. s162]|jgi:radical SAM/CxCxxxxC motif protein YfkAB|uniref:radical SAM/CxCxxxxC motif protein YfkAB n=1 Tax=Exiguobacterium sp. s162 TaxID=2751276 RepID=UPI001BEAAE1C|nr:radical SAM/CxCxxxxC motif protein YfkAB [Exiguobacterium sp. s162]
MQNISPTFDPWEAYLDQVEHGRLVLSNVEVTTTKLCNMRCEHCAVGYMLDQTEEPEVPLDLLIQRLDEIEHLRAFSITGGEPMLSMKSVRNYVVPLLRYAKERGARTQINSNLTLPLSRYHLITPYLDVLHISHNWGTDADFLEGGFAMMDRKPSEEARLKMLQTMKDNARALTAEGVIVSAETMINKRTIPHLKEIHEEIVSLGCQRHEVHPMYPADWASALESASLADTRQAIHDLLDVRDENVWMLFGTLPFYACSDLPEDRALLKRLHETKNVTVRNDPDGRSRLNTNIFDGQIIVTDFGDELGSLGTVYDTSFQEAYDTWTNSQLNATLSCHCPAVKCLGPNALVKQAYYPTVDFQSRKATSF